ncbi:hypothetical protein [Rhizobium redzepovicii]|uniref:hypothetical protein n=1 Tax=Rhizobium redzepovicii TaxID=2867518 RepID=UPI0028721CE4|nr:hypothetical protein [Rhizobium redzepovicii]MDR9781127.1 hypothetical protein [Rhizobium redzepovicii]
MSTNTVCYVAAIVLPAAVNLSAVYAQEPDTLSVIPLDRAAPETIELDTAKKNADFMSFAKGGPATRKTGSLGQAVVQNAAKALQRSAPAALLTLTNLDTTLPANQENEFFAVIDVPSIARGKAAGARVFKLEERATEVEGDFLTIEDRTQFGSPGQGWFSTNYPELHANLRCDWVYNTRIARAIGDEDLKAREAQLEADYRARKLERDNPDISTLQEPEAGNDQAEEGLIGMERQFTLAGRPCLLTYLCDDRQNVPCSEEIADELVERVVLIRTGSES